jgi:elongator complex protein 1
MCISEDLSGKKRYSEAARVLLDHCGDVHEAVITLTQGNEFSEARRIVRLYRYCQRDLHCANAFPGLQIAVKRVPELIEEIIHPAALESKNQMMEDLKEMKEQIRKQMNRLRELRVKKIEEPGTYS